MCQVKWCQTAVKSTKPEVITKLLFIPSLSSQEQIEKFPNLYKKQRCCFPCTFYLSYFDSWNAWHIDKLYVFP